MRIPAVIERLKGWKERTSLRPLIVLLIIVPGLILLPPLLAIGTLIVVDIRNHRHFHRIQAQLEKMPGVKIIDTWMHQDITLEDFGFDLKVRECPPIRLNFYERGDWFRPFEKIDGISFFKYPGIKGQHHQPGSPPKSLGKRASKFTTLETFLRISNPFWPI